MAWLRKTSYFKDSHVIIAPLVKHDARNSAGILISLENHIINFTRDLSRMQTEVYKITSLIKQACKLLLGMLSG